MGILNWLNDKAAAALDSTVGRPNSWKNASRPEETIANSAESIGIPTNQNQLREFVEGYNRNKQANTAAIQTTIGRGMITVARSISSEVPTDQEIVSIEKLLDQNKDGIISKHEIAEARDAAVAATILDSDRNAKITGAEISKFVKQARIAGFEFDSDIQNATVGEKAASPHLPNVGSNGKIERQ